MIDGPTGWLLALKWELIRPVVDAVSLGLSALAFEPGAFRVAATSAGRDLALLMAFLAGMSQAAGHGLVLFFNRVPFTRFVLSLVLMALIYLASAVVTAVSTTIAVEYAFRREVAYGPVIGIIALAQAPRLFGILTLAPYFGEALSRFLDVLVFGLILFGLHHGIGIPVGIAAMAALLGWVAIRLMSLLFGRPFGFVIERLHHAAAGGALTVTSQNLADHLIARARKLTGGRKPGE
ncbi:hypothetical protein EJC49_06100 [Aquibium carbonis]|uniref:Uncharacterized protein n=1 Tax=Aquibium carbonis TaxID=2495581 RepID=A0A429Z0Y2_9HYPH|nr:hypothetical protein [Aquibium carbonis]RST87375.1 hypothetical protein EJC49_06100 [Aquibium carbonis]